MFQGKRHDIAIKWDNGKVTVRRFNDPLNLNNYNWGTLDVSTFQKRYAGSTAIKLA